MLLGTEGRAWTKRVPRDQAITSCPRLEVLTSLALTNHVLQRLDEPDMVSFHSGMVLLENFEALKGVRLALYQSIGVFFFFLFFSILSFAVKNGWWKSAVLHSQPMDTKASDRWLERPRCPAKGLLPWRIGGFRGTHKLLINTWNKAREGEKDGFNILPKLLPSYRACLYNSKNNSGVMHWFIWRRTTAPNLSVPVWHLLVFFALVKYLLVFVNPHHFHCFWTLPRSRAAAEDFVSHPHLSCPGPPPPAARSISGFVKAAMPLETQRVSPGCSQEQRRDIYTDIKVHPKALS